MSKNIHALLIIASLIPLTSGCNTPPENQQESSEWYSESKPLYAGIPVSVTFYPANKKTAQKVWAYLEGINGIFNAYQPSSELGKLNASTKTSRKLSPALKEAYLKARLLHTKTDGAFDITIRPLINLWKTAAKQNSPPSTEEIKSALKTVGLERSQLDDANSTISMPEGMQLDFGGLIKGMGVDGAIALIKEGGATSALVQVGGESGAFGYSKHNRPYRIGVQHPTKMNKIWSIIESNKQGISVSTSGNYRQPIMIAGTPYYHIIDPKTGTPVNTNTLSVTIYFNECGKNGLADGISTAATVLGPAQGIKLANKFGAEALIIYRQPNGEIKKSKTPGWDAQIKNEKK